jgi:hypothetical protein
MLHKFYRKTTWAKKDGNVKEDISFFTKLKLEETAFLCAKFRVLLSSPLL